MLSVPGDHVPTDRAGRVLHPELRLQLQSDPVLAPLGMIGRDAANQADVAPRDSGPTAWPTGPTSPVVPVSSPVPPEDRRLAGSAPARIATDSSV